MAQRKTVQERLEAAKLKTNPRYSMHFSDVIEIMKSEKDVAKMICIAFQYGYLQGSKATKKEYEAARAKARDNT